MATTSQPPKKSRREKFFRPPSIKFSAFKVLSRLQHDRIRAQKPTIQHPDYKPLALRWPFITSLFLLLCLVIALLEYTRRVLPDTKYSTRLQPFPLRKQQSTSGSITTVYARTAVEVSAKAIAAHSTQSPRAWIFKNATSLRNFNDTRTVFNGSTSPTEIFSRNQTTSTTALATQNNPSSAPTNYASASSGDVFANKTELHDAIEKYPSPDNFANYLSLLGPALPMKWLCTGEAGPAGRLPILYLSGESKLPGVTCRANITLWLSDDPSDCKGQFVWAGGGYQPPWTSKSAYDIRWDIYLGTGGYVDPRTNCNLLVVADAINCFEGCSTRPPGFDWDWGANYNEAATTTLQIKEAITTTKQLPGSEIDILEVITGVDGRPTQTNMKTMLVSGGVSIFTTDITHVVTAIGYPGERAWKWAEQTSTSASSLGPLDPPEVLGSYRSTVTTSSTVTLESNVEDSSGIFPMLTETLFDSEGVPIETLNMRLDILTDYLGRPTGTVTDFLQTFTGSAGLPMETINMRLDILSDASGRPTATIGEYLETLTDSKGLPTKTITIASTRFFGPRLTTPKVSLVTLLDSNGRPTETETVSFQTFTDSAGRPIGTLAEFTGSSTISGGFSAATSSRALPKNIYPNGETKNLLPVHIEPSNYFFAAFAPVLMSVLLSTFVQIINRSLKTMLPFYALTKSRGATAKDSLCMMPGGFGGPFQSIHLLFRFGEPISLLCDILVILAAILVSISSEAVGIDLSGWCEVDSFRGCSMSFSVYEGPFRTTEGLVITMAILVALIGVLTCRTRSGVSFKPWSIASSASLLSREIRNLLLSLPHDTKEKSLDTELIAKHLEGKRFTFGTHFGDVGNSEYGIITADDTSSRSAAVKAETSKSSRSNIRFGRAKRRFNYYFFHKQFLTDFGFRVMFLTILFGFFVLILYYDTVELKARNNSFERFMDSQKYGVRTLFTGLGVIISFFWDDMFSRVSRMQPYKELTCLPRRSNALIFASSATTVFPGLWAAIHDRNIFTGSVALAGILSKFTPILLSNIPFRVTQTWETHKVCAWMTVSILILMMLILIWSFFIRWPHMPIDPSTIAGNMYYLCDDSVLRDFEGTAMMGEKELKTHLRGVGGRYKFGERIGGDGQKRIGVFRDRSIASLWG